MNNHKQVERRRWQTMLRLIQKCEDKYGSIIRTPDDDPNFAEIQRICGANPSPIEIAVRKRDLVVEKIESGFSKTYIVRHYHVAPDTVEKIKRKFNLSFKPVWLYVLYKDNEPVYFIRSKKLDIPIIFNRTFYNDKILKSFLLNNGFKLRVRKAIWHNIPIGAYYATPDHEKVIQKIDEEYRE